MTESSARKALDEWYTGATDDPSKVVMYLENVLAALRTVAAQPHAPIDGIGTDGAVHVYEPGHPMGCSICEAIEIALGNVQADNKQEWNPDHPSYDEMGQ